MTPADWPSGHQPRRALSADPAAIQQKRQSHPHQGGLYTERTDVAIVVGGIAGGASAYSLARAGMKATVIERERVSMQASGFAAGGLNPLRGMAEALKPLAMEAFGLHQARRMSMITVVFDDAAVVPFLRVLPSVMMAPIA